MRVPENLRRNVTEAHGRAGREWLGRLPSILSECAARWSLELGEPFGRLSYNYVVRAARADGTKVVLKLGPPVRELLTEIAALRIFDGRGSVRLFDADERLGALLLERLEPGTTLWELPDEAADEAATHEAAEVMRELWRPAPAAHDFPTVAGWGEGFGRHRARFGGGSGPLPPALFGEAESLFREFSDTQGEPVLLHGDLHHDNLLAASRAPRLAIDPKGLVGEPAYEVGALLRNPLPRLFEFARPREVTARRVEQLSRELGVGRARVRGWGLAQAVLSAVWTIEDGGSDWQPALECARLLAAVRE